MSQDQSLAVIDATDAQVLPPEASPFVLTERQADELEKCGFHLLAIGRKIAVREIDLIYHYVEAGWWLMRAQEVHRCAVTAQRQDGTFAQQENSGFTRWLEGQNIGVNRRQAYSYIQGARNAGLTPESNILALQTLKAEKKLHGQTLTALCRKPVNKDDQQPDEHVLTDEERLAAENAERIERWNLLGEQLVTYGLEQEDWSHLELERRKALYDLVTELARRVRPSIKKLVGDKSLALEVKAH